MTLSSLGKQREDAETLGRMFPLDCSRFIDAEKSGAFNHRGFAASLKRLRNSSFDYLLLYEMDKYSSRAVLSLARKTLAEGFRSLRMEIPLETASAENLIADLLKSGVDEVHVTVTKEGPPLKAREWRKAASSLKKIYSAAKRLERNHSIRVKTALPRSIAASEKALRMIAGAGAGYIFAEYTPPQSARSEADKLSAMCRNLSGELDAAIELRIGDTAEVFRGPSHRQREAEELLLDIPYCIIADKRFPLGAVFQLGFNCGQNCIFCTSDRTLPEATHEKILSVLNEVLSKQIPRVVFTGGEPTLNRNLCDYIAMCKSAGVAEVSLYTNGMALASSRYVGRLADAGLDLCLVSLHSLSAYVSDRITRRPGGFRKTVKGIENLLATRTLTIINYVINSLNYTQTPDFVRFINERFPGTPLNFSYVAPVMKDTASSAIVPRFTDAAPYIREALDVCGELGLTATGLEPHWGMPPCVLGGDKRYFPLLPPVVEKFSGFVKSASCAACRLGRSCPGVRKHYAGLYGLGELTALK